MAALSTVQDYVNAARTLLQDKVAPYRYPDSDFVDALNFGMLQARRMRADLFLSVSSAPGFSTTPSFSSSSMTTTVTMDEQYRVAFVFYLAGHVQLQDEEDVQDARAAAFVQKFTAMLTAPA